MTQINDLAKLPSDLPIPEDDGACAHLTGMQWPSIELLATDGRKVDITKEADKCVIFTYPRTGRPGVPALTEEWNHIPGARGCTPQTCGFRDLAASFVDAGYTVFGLSTQTSTYQREMVGRLQVPFQVLSDEALELTNLLRLPTFSVAGQTLLKRMTLIVERGTIVKVFYPVFPPDRNAADVLAWILQGHGIAPSVR